MMKHLILSLILVAGLGAHAQDDLESLLDEGQKPVTKQTQAKNQATGLSSELQKLIGNTTPEQNVFLRYIEAEAWDKATLQYLQAFERTSFQKSANGRAVFGLVQFKSGLAVTGIETLFMADAGAIAPALQSAWKSAVPANHFVWDTAKVAWSSAWTKIFGSEVEYKIKTRELASITNLNELKKLSQTAPEGTKEKAQIDWQLVLAYSLNDQAAEAAKLLAKLMQGTHAPVSRDLMQLTAARLLFQNGYFDASIKYYDKVSKASEFWTEAQEEMAWAYIRKGEPQNAIAISKSLVVPAMKNQVGPEAFFVSSLSQLKVCDYTGVTKDLIEFPKQFKARTKALTDLAKSGESKEVAQVIDLLKVRKIRLQDLGKNADILPRMITRDEKLYDFVQMQKHLEAEAKTAEVLYSKSLALTGLQGYFENLKQSTSHRAHMAKASAQSRVKELAQVEVDETKEILRKLHIVEAEVIQQVALAETVAKNTKAIATEKRGVTGAKGPDTISFPADDEVWFDEISNYKVDVKKACHAKR